jgi:hypothetical protein
LDGFYPIPRDTNFWGGKLFSRAFHPFCISEIYYSKEVIFMSGQDIFVIIILGALVAGFIYVSFIQNKKNKDE